MNRVNNLFLSSLLLLMLTATACSGLTRSDKPATRTWWLQPYTGMAQDRSPDQPVSIAVSVSVVPGLDTDRILTLSDDSQLSQYTAARWTDALPELVVSLAARTLQSSGRFKVDSGHAGGANKACELQLEVREFFARINASGSTSEIRLAIAGQYRCPDGLSVPIDLDATVPVFEERMSVIVAAFQSGMDKLMNDLLGLLKH